METEFKDIKFKYTFRDYQKEALDMLEKYKNDAKIHVVAAPGAGKTILALELLIRIGKKALILAPTIAIKEQWIERLKKDFENGDSEELISTNLENPSIVTIITYQALYSMNRKKVDIEKIIIDNNIRTIILDEAHHLRKVWFKTLKKIVDNLKNCTTIALTATPPYDNGNDFANYMSLCGDIDAKITIPQLVKSKCLCTHQDYIYFNTPTEEQEKRLEQYQENIKQLMLYLEKNENFIKAIALHDYIVNAEENVSQIIDEFDFYIAMLSFLSVVNCKYPENEFNKKIRIPKFDTDLMEIILERYFFGKNIEEKEIFKETFKEIKEKLNLLGCIDEKKINLKYNKELSDMLLKNSGKLESINEIIKIEQKSLAEKLKLVVVTDYIKDEYYDIVNEDDINVIGVVPIFRKILSENIIVKMAVLTGTLIIIPTDLKEKLLEIAYKEYNINSEEIEFSELGINFNYSEVKFQEKHKRFSVNLITKLFHQSDISVLLGTVALIGEGWDAPFVNSLIIASFVSSYVTSNQVRGRAIRINKADFSKNSNIWHLVCVEKEKNYYILGQDYEMLSKRFFAYEGINSRTKIIDSGIERLNVKNKKYTKEELTLLNNSMICDAMQRDKLKEIWKDALKNYKPICKEIIPMERLYKNRSGRVIQNTKAILSLSEIGIDLGIGLAVIFGLTHPGILWTIFLNRYIFDKFTNSEKYFIKKICKATYLSMCKMNNLDSKIKYYIKTEKQNIEYGLKNADTYEQMQFINSVKEALTLDYNNRYIIKSGNHVYAVPEKFSRNKKDAKMFLKHLELPLTASLIYTKSESGKNVLLKHKMKEFTKRFC